MREIILLILTVMMIGFSQVWVNSQTGPRGIKPRGTGETRADEIGYAASHALVIGVSDYVSWRKLPGVAEDIPAVAALFKRLGFAVETPKVESREDFNRELDQFISKYGRNVDNRLMIYFAGHGYTENRADGVQVGYVVMKDAPLNPAEAGFDLSLVSMDELNARAIRIGARHVMFIFDSCFAGTIFSRSTGNSNGGKAPPLIMEKAALPVRQFITSGTAMQEVPDRSDFRLLLVRAFDDRAADFYPRDGYVTGEELGRYLAGQVASVSRGTQTPEYGKIKEVRLQRGDMVFRLPNEKAEEKVTTPSESSGACDLAWGDLERSPSETGYEIFIKNCRSSKWLITAEIRLAAIRAAAVVRPVQDTNEAVGLEFWRSIAESQNVRDYEGYLRQFPNGQFAELARSRIEKLRLPVYRSVSFKTGQITESKLTPSQGECEVYTEDLGNGVKLEMVKIPGGEFQMGSPDSESGRDKDEGPVHRVTLKGFLMGRYEVTQRVWRSVAALPKIELELNPEPSVFKGDELPVESVTWNEVKEFIARLNRKLGLDDAKGYRLPSESEWEYAARGVTATPFGFGETISTSIVNYDGNYRYGRGKKGERRGKTIAVGSLGLANRFGLYDMHGNVWEWCEDEYHENYNGAPIDGRAWVSSGVAALRVFRGGSWNNRAVGCRSAARSGGAPGGRFDGLGFRLSRTLP